MSELTQAQLLELVNTKKLAPGNARVRQLTASSPTCSRPSTNWM